MKSFTLIVYFKISPYCIQIKVSNGILEGKTNFLQLESHIHYITVQYTVYVSHHNNIITDSVNIVFLIKYYENKLLFLLAKHRKYMLIVVHFLFLTKRLDLHVMCDAIIFNDFTSVKVSYSKCF